MHEDNLIGDQVTVKLNFRSGRKLLLFHHEIWRASVLTFNLWNER